MEFRITRRRFGALSTGLFFASTSRVAFAESMVVVPGSGAILAGDDFEEPSWTYNPNGKKSSHNLDKEVRLPGGISSNRRWVEPALRGQPDVVQRVDTPPEGNPESAGAMLMQSLQTGVPGKPSNEVQQDDFLLNLEGRFGGQLPVAWTPNCIARVYLPAFSKWEKRAGNSFGFRVGLRATHKKEVEDVLDYEEYWPGMFIYFRYGGGRGENGALLMIRSDKNGRDMKGPALKEKTWYTFGMSLTPDGAVHYFAQEGTAALRAENHLMSQYPYGYRAAKFETMFFNVVNRDDGKTWSTPWVVDDCYLHAATLPEDFSRNGMAMRAIEPRKRSTNIRKTR